MAKYVDGLTIRKRALLLTMSSLRLIDAHTGFTLEVD